ncbi:two-component system phosphate regulon response regulator PhoB [Pseudoduganella lurida]|uniref:Two-component system phosphate regulon response regulator PhoB n=1 Tax=Pseudoduganella lurida TaxID=1036180 RepID=A0A562R9S0_9BURK|nr:winged helix-turn-helix domain-containing protein [Pseudoduganella lurida]TWI65126.1 two-component system phosphate regulon response regulator PhoB [Pseudoduganella lurida]
MPFQVLLIDSDLSVQQQLGDYLRQAGHGVCAAADAESALVLIDETPPDIALLEWDLPGQSGLALIRRLRAQPATAALPLMMVAARSGEQDKVLALEAGADDYLTKPFGPREAIARVHAVLRRHRPVLPAGLHIDRGAQRVMAGSRQIVLGRVEYRLLNFLMQHPQRVHTRAQLLDQVWGADAYLDERTVDAHVGRLRNALQPCGYHGRIETVRGSGYRFNPDRVPQPLPAW